MQQYGRSGGVFLSCIAAWKEGGGTQSSPPSSCCCAVPLQQLSGSGTDGEGYTGSQNAGRCSKSHALSARLNFFDLFWNGCSRTRKPSRASAGAAGKNKKGRDTQWANWKAK